MPQFSLSSLWSKILRRFLFAAFLATALNVQAQRSEPGSAGQDANEISAVSPVRLRQATTQNDDSNGAAEASNASRRTNEQTTNQRPSRPIYVPGEFERYVQRAAGDHEGEIRRLGANLVTGESLSTSNDVSPLVPGDYLVAPGDEVLVSLWGSVEADLRATVDRAGRIVIPRVGAIQVAGVRSADLQDLLSRRVAQVFKNFQLSVSLGQLRGIRIFVSGFAVKPGSYTVSSLSSVLTALMRAGGPSSSGSFRNIALRRGSATVAVLDLYELLLQGDRSSDRILQGGDVIHIGAVGAQVGFIGSVNRPAVVELKPGETLNDAINMVGGFSAVADRGRVAIERLQDRNSQRIELLELPRDLKAPLGQGDMLRAFSAVDLVLPSQRQSKRVRVEGEVLRPGDYILPEGSTIADALRQAGGFTPLAYIYATEFTRISVRETQQQNYDRVLTDMETELARTTNAQRVSNADDAAAQAAKSATSARLIERLRALRPTGRVILSLPVDTKQLPNFALEESDRIYVPPQPTTVGVFGSVFNVGSYLFLHNRLIGDYLELAGGPTKGADLKSVFVVHPNGSVSSQLQRNSGFFGREALAALNAQPGDTIFVPEEIDKTTFIQSAKDWAQILSQFGLGVAAIRSITR